MPSASPPPPETTTVAVVQLECIDGDVDRNLREAEKHVAAAASAGARIVLLPELLAAGYDMSPALWDSAEPLDGPTVRWLQATCRRHAVWAGTSFLESTGTDFHNTFALVDPSGRVAGTVRKEFPAAAEAYRFRGAPGPHVIDTEFGRIGIGICYESLTRPWAEQMLGGDVDLILLSFSGPVSTTSRFNPPENGRAFEELLVHAPGAIAKLVGVPVAFANKTGSWRTKMPFPLPNEDSFFPGTSRITDARGETLTALGRQEGHALATVQLGSVGAAPERLPAGRWNQPVPDFFSLFRVPEFLGPISYGWSGRRRRVAKRTLASS